jgi:hypothetical protein
MATELKATNEVQEPSGLYDKYIVTKTDGSPIDPEEVLFLLRLDKDPFARRAACTYAFACREENPTLAKDLLALVQELEHKAKERSIK